MDIILTYWWQFLIVVAAIVVAAYVLGKSMERILVIIKDTVVTLVREPFFKTAPSRATAVNVIMLIFSGIGMIALVIPNALIQLGLQEQKGSFYTIVGIIQFMVVGGGSGYGIHLFEKSFPAFRDDEAHLGNQGNNDDKNSKNKKQKRRVKGK